jgi:hypothetical protein
VQLVQFDPGPLGERLGVRLDVGERERVLGVVANVGEKEDLEVD